MKITAKFHAWRRRRFENIERIMSRDMLPKTFETFDKRAPAGLARPNMASELITTSAFALKR